MSRTNRSRRQNVNQSKNYHPVPAVQQYIRRIMSHHYYRILAYCINTYSINGRRREDVMQRATTVQYIERCGTVLILRQYGTGSMIGTPQRIVCLCILILLQQTNQSITLLVHESIDTTPTDTDKKDKETTTYCTVQKKIKLWNKQ